MHPPAFPTQVLERGEEVGWLMFLTPALNSIEHRSESAGAPARSHELAACESGDDYFSECVEL